MNSNCKVENSRTTLFRKIADFPLDRGRIGAFSCRLRRDLGWSPHFTQRAIAEYRKFLWIAATSGREVTPSKVVDEVWHLHILHTQSYFNDLCRDTLGCVLHHNPGDGSAADARFPDNYRATLALYEATFGPPPADIWPRPETVARPTTSSPRPWLAFAPAALFPTPANAATTAARENDILALIALMVIAFGVVLGRNFYDGLRDAPRNSRKSSSDDGGVEIGVSIGGTDCNDGGGSDSGASCGGSCGSGCGGGCGNQLYF